MKMYDYKIMPNDNSNIIPAFIDKHSLFCTGYSSGKYKDVLQAPVHHALIIMRKRIYKLHNKDKTSFVIEKIDNLIHVLFFCIHLYTVNMLLLHYKHFIRPN